MALLLSLRASVRALALPIRGAPAELTALADVARALRVRQLSRSPGPPAASPLDRRHAKVLGQHGENSLMAQPRRTCRQPGLRVHNGSLGPALACQPDHDIVETPRQEHRPRNTDGGRPELSLNGRNPHHITLDRPNIHPTSTPNSFRDRPTIAPRMPQDGPEAPQR